MFDAIVLAGGRSRRMGVDKTTLGVGGLSLLDRVLGASAGAHTTVVVGPQRPTARPVVWGQEPVAGGGPVPALRTGLELVSAEVVVLLAADLPHLTEPQVRLLAEQAPVVGMGDGRQQWLCSGWPTDVLRAAVAATASDRLGAVLGALPYVELALEGDTWLDCDTPEDLEQARRRHG